MTKRQKLKNDKNNPSDLILFDINAFERDADARRKARQKKAEFVCTEISKMRRELLIEEDVELWKILDKLIRQVRY